jgi:hypothetical protein
MERRRFGRADQLVPVIGQGTSHLETESDLPRGRLTGGPQDRGVTLHPAAIMRRASASVGHRHRRQGVRGGPDRAMGKSFAFLRKYAARDPCGRREVDHSYR